MPPKRKSPAAAAPAAGSPRKTRSMTGAGKRGTEASPAKAALTKKEEEAVVASAEQKGRKRAPKKVEEIVRVVAEPKGRKKAKKDADSEPMAEEDGGVVPADGKRVIVEACTQCTQFKRRAQKVKEDLESSVPGVSVVINPEKPRRGCLEIREEGGEVFISLLNMPRPFTAMKKLDMDEVIKDIAKKIS
ncbi:hypothetical protein PR202_gb23801 [Eleusine coracana subsp. coracana]|uniref:Selenoprotein H n=1 Tax=Eleusine coracana subsp. coracana TaxID=191504 RepID=A0AAV5FH59_ELECO|nr:hypothetical protein QOZ80_5BG0437700 [Eleusine coracana subsp. coracana]GJN35068.1 hypothetical protein PR202_gb23801 [Eleusine coracana subsp. coracana]